MSNYKVSRCGDICVIKENGRTVAEMIGDAAIIHVKGLMKMFVGDVSAIRIRVRGKPKSLRLAKRKIKELERILWE